MAQTKRKVIIVGNSLIIPVQKKRITKGLDIVEVDSIEQCTGSVVKGETVALVISHHKLHKSLDVWHTTNLDKCGVLIIMRPRMHLLIELRKDRERNIFEIPTFADCHAAINYIDCILDWYELKKKNAELDSIVQAFEGAFEFSRQELKFKTEEIRAWEKQAELSRTENINSDKTEKALEEITEFQRKELINGKEESNAWGNVVEYVQNRIDQMEKDISARDQLEDFQRQEKIISELLNNSWDEVNELSRLELLTLIEALKDYHLQKDKVLSDLQERLQKKITDALKRQG